ncbi:MAG: hypothetical protein EON58_16560, partial [Alphaproteobacteria bacterium]
MPSIKRRILTAFALALPLSATVTDDAFAWGRKGHAVIARIAEENLTPDVHRRVLYLLRIDGAKDMASVASWADTQAAKNLPDRPMHTVRMSMNSAPYSEAADCIKKCVIKGLEQAEAVLADPASSEADQVIALKDVIHFIGDIHQPLHAVENIGGQPVILGGKPSTLHEVWDTLIIRSQETSVRKLAKRLDQTSMLRSDSSGGPPQWAEESRDIAMTQIYSEVPPSTKRSAPTVLNDDYAARHWPIVETRLKQAGLRLAATLN